MIVYTTISGAVGALVPFVSMDDVEFMTTLEMVSGTLLSPSLFLQVRTWGGDAGRWSLVLVLVLLPDWNHTDILPQHMRAQNVSLVGRDHLAYRGYYVPVLDVVDGDLCESFSSLPYPKQQGIAADLDRSVGDVLKKLEQMRTSSAF